MMKSRVLIVEDEADIRRFVRMALEREGMSAFEAGTAEEARIDAGCRRPDMVIVDLGLPDEDGKLLIRELRDLALGSNSGPFGAREGIGEGRGPGCRS